MRLYIVRHGESEANVRSLWAGRNNSVHLTEKGREDARKAGKILSSCHMDKVYTSSLERAIETARIAVPYLQSQIWKEIDETGLGSLELMPPEERNKLGEALDRAMETRDFSPFGGEDRPTVQKRVWNFMREMEREDPDLFIAVFTHFWPVIEMLSYVEGRNLTDRDHYPDNGSVILLEYRYGRWSRNRALKY